VKIGHGLAVASDVDRYVDDLYFYRLAESCDWIERRRLLGLPGRNPEKEKSDSENRRPAPR
jgi:hypothetical protein